MALVLGIAFGAAATRAEVRDADTGGLVAHAEVRHTDLGTETDDPTLWWRSLTAAVEATGEREIAAISVCGSHPGLVLLDGAGAVLRPLPSWDDHESTAVAGGLTRSLGAERWATRIGALPEPSTAITRLAWLRRADPATFERVGAALLPHDWLTYRLTGRAVTDRGGASLTGAWSPAAEGWLAEVLEELVPGGSPDDWRRRLPEVLAPAQPADWLDAPVYELLGLRGRPLVGAGTGEVMAVALALGVGPGQAAVLHGQDTSALVGTERPVSDPSGRARSRADATGRHLAVVTSPGGDPLVTAVGRVLGVEPGAVGAMAVGHEPRGDGDPILVPGVAGRAGAVLAGLGAGTGPEAVARAAFEGLACTALDDLDHLAEVGAPWDDGAPLGLAAPAVDLAAHARVLADLAVRPVRPAPIGSLAAGGACVQAAAVLTETAPDEVAAAWALDAGALVEPVDDPTRQDRRQAHADEVARQQRAARRKG